MNFHQIADLLRQNGVILIAVVVVVSPIIWRITSYIFKNRLEEKEAENKKLKKELNKLESDNVESNSGKTEEGKVKWNYNFPDESPIISLFPETNNSSQRDLEVRIEEAEEKITIFGLTRGFFASGKMRRLMIKKSQDVPITFFVMDPDCDSRRHRYRIEPLEASLEDPDRFRREVENPFRELLSNVNFSPAGSSIPGVSLYYYNFPCSFAIEEIDNACRVMPYGHGKRGTEGPILVFRSENPYFEYFSSQLRWLEKLATDHPMPEWENKGISLRRLKADGQKAI